MHKQKSVLKNETHKVLLDFEIQTDYLIPARIPHLVIINKQKRTYKIVDFGDQGKLREKNKESKKRDVYLDLDRELKKSYGT